MATDVHQHAPAVTLGAYRLGRVLGCGGMATVYAGVQPALGRPVAIKVLHRHLAADSVAAARFLREGRAIARIRHENVVDVFDSGEQDGVPFLVMELLEGDDLLSYLRRVGTAPHGELIDLILPVIAGVQAAHAAGIVHRDLKPANIRLARDARAGIVPKVLDFGISKWREADSDAALTCTDSGLGTASYMSPEQLRSAKYVDQRSDVYALGVILYECCTGRRPFSGDTVYDVMHAIVTMPLVPPRAVRPELPALLDDVVVRAMERDPAARFESAAALGRALAPLASDPARWDRVFSLPAVEPPVGPETPCVRDVSMPVTFVSAAIPPRAARRRGGAGIALAGLATVGTILLLSRAAHTPGARGVPRAPVAITTVATPSIAPIEAIQWASSVQVQGQTRSDHERPPLLAPRSLDPLSPRAQSARGEPAPVEAPPPAAPVEVPQVQPTLGTNDAPIVR